MHLSSAQLGISVQPARPYTPTDKAPVERFFRALREDLLQTLPVTKARMCSIVVGMWRTRCSSSCTSWRTSDVHLEHVLRAALLRERMLVPARPGLVVRDALTSEQGRNPCESSGLGIPCTCDLVHVEEHVLLTLTSEAMTHIHDCRPIE